MKKFSCVCTASLNFEFTFSSSHGKLFLVLLEANVQLLENAKKDCKILELFQYKVFVHLKQKLLDFQEKTLPEKWKILLGLFSWLLQIVQLYRCKSLDKTCICKFFRTKAFTILLEVHNTVYYGLRFFISIKPQDRQVIFKRLEAHLKLFVLSL